MAGLQREQEKNPLAGTSDHGCSVSCKQMTHHVVRLHRVLFCLVGVLERQAQRVDDPHSGEQRQKVQHRVDVILHHEAAAHRAVFSPHSQEEFGSGLLQSLGCQAPEYSYLPGTIRHNMQINCSPGPHIRLAEDFI